MRIAGLTDPVEEESNPVYELLQSRRYFPRQSYT
jgi:hypothetical protein